jgi:A/G-specific adenine glycosylase
MADPYGVLGWYARNARSFPWRRTTDPYAILVSEVMLQQTQTARVVPIYEAFLARFPAVRDLARAERGAVIRAWQGLGYNRRAVSLHRAAHAIERRHGGVVPRDPAVLRTLPGVGEYTASAVACFAYGARVAVVDTNVRRVLARAMLGVEASDVGAGALATLAQELLPRRSASRWNQALMDIGATMCRARAPRCERCPLRDGCLYLRNGGAARSVPRPRREPFAGSRRQARGRVVGYLRSHRNATVAELELALPEGSRSMLTDVLRGLEDDGLVVLGPAARRGSARGLVRLPGRDQSSWAPTNPAS